MSIQCIVLVILCVGGVCVAVFLVFFYLSAMSSAFWLVNEGFRVAQHRPGTKRSIKFDDRLCSLFMDVKLPGVAWVQITPEHIHQASRGCRVKWVPAVADILELSSRDLPEESDAPSARC